MERTLLHQPGNNNSLSIDQFLLQNLVFSYQKIDFIFKVSSTLHTLKKYNAKKLYCLFNKNFIMEGIRNNN